MRSLFVSRLAYDLVVAERDRLLSERNTLQQKCEAFERAALKSADSPIAQRYIAEVSPEQPSEEDPEPPYPGDTASFGVIQTWYLAHEEWLERHSKAN